MNVRPACADDAAAIARIYNEGIEDGFATFETRQRTAAEIESWLEEGIPVVVGEEAEVIAWAAAHPYRPGRECYYGVAEFSIYVARGARGRGAGKATLSALAAECEARGFWKLLSRVFPENEASLALCRSLGFREVGVYRNHGRLGGEWKDVVIVELLLGEAAG
jgi:L-amino acid N-acyltransferase YncA